MVAVKYLGVLWFQRDSTPNLGCIVYGANVLKKVGFTAPHVSPPYAPCKLVLGFTSGI